MYSSQKYLKSCVIPLTQQVYTYVPVYIDFKEKWTLVKLVIVDKNGYHSPNICQWSIYRCSNPYGFKNNVCKYIDLKIHMDCGDE